jgi:hypothetical protein
MKRTALLLLAIDPELHLAPWWHFAIVGGIGLIAVIAMVLIARRGQHHDFGAESEADADSRK